MFYRCYNNVLPGAGDAMSLRKAAEMALEVMEYNRANGTPNMGAAIEALRQALAQPEQEPVGYVTIETISSWAKVPSIKWFKKPTQGPLYTAPPKREWVGLTDSEVIEMAKASDIWGGDISKAILEFAASIEIKLEEKNSV